MSVNIQNPGSALGEAVGAEMEKALNRFLDEVAEEAGCHFVCTGPKAKTKKGVEKKLLLHDAFGVAYNIDSVIANAEMQPLIIIECKYIRYKKHNRDKGSWICTAHSAIRRRYNSVRSSIAVLAGSWSRTSVAMMKSHDVSIFLLPFDPICDLLQEYAIQFAWEEKDRSLAAEGWRRFNRLGVAQKTQIGQRMIQPIMADLRERVLKVLDDTVPREIDKVTVEVHSNLGEVKVLEFESVPQAIAFLESDPLRNFFDTSASPSLFDSPPSVDDEI